jgi:hypothetical protein
MKDWQLVILAAGGGVVTAIVFCYLLCNWVFGP